MVTISPVLLTFNRHVVEKMNLSRQRNVMLFYNPKLKIIAIKPSPVETENTYRVFVNKNRNASLTVRGFLKTTGLIVTLGFLKNKESKRFRAVWSYKEKVLYVPLTSEAFKKLSVLEEEEKTDE